MNLTSLRRGTRRPISAPIVLAIALAACGGGGGGGSGPDTTNPTGTFTAPAGAVSRQVTLQATAADDRGVTQVEFLVDGTSVGTDTTAPYSATWDSGAVADGVHTVTLVVMDAAGNSTTTPGVSITVSNVRDYPVTLSGAEVFPETGSAGAASGSFNVNLATGAVSGAVTVTGIIAVAAHIHDGFAGSDGAVAVGLEQDGSNAASWRVPAGAALAPVQVDRLLAGALYVNVHTAQFQGGEIRGQILPVGVVVYFSDLTGSQEVPEVSDEARGRAAVTVDTAARIVSVHLNTLGADGTAGGFSGANGAHLHNGIAGTNGPVIVALAQDAGLASHWSVDETQLAQADYDALVAAGTYVNVHTGNHPDGALRGQVVPPGHVVVVGAVDGEQQVPQPFVTAARGNAAVTVDTATGAADIVVNVTGADDATAAHLHDAYGGANGPVVVELARDSGSTTVWRSNGATLTSTQVDALLAGRYYANVHTPAAPGGLVRGQLLPAGVDMVVSHMNGAQEDGGPIATNATGRATATVDRAARKVSVHVNTQGLTGAVAAHVHSGARGAAGAVVFGLDVDAADATRWSAVDVDATALQLADYLAGLWYVNVHTAANPNGEVRGQLELPGVRPLQYVDLQQRFFDATCATSGCHSGAGAPLGLDLGATVSHANLVGVASGEVPALLRVAPGDAPASYLARKLDGAAGIVGERMPNGLPPLPAASIARIKAWINAGALDAPAPPADTTAPTVTLGSVAATVSGTVTLTATASDDTGVTLVRFRVDGTEVGSDATAPYEFAWDTTAAANGAVTIDAQAVDAAGNVGTSASTSATVSNNTGPTPYTFSEIQSQIFTPTCAVSGCHTGGSPAGGMNLSAPAYPNIVDVASSEIPSLRRIDPGDADNSYLIQKLEGAPGIQGQRMPFGGPYLDQPTIDRIRAWVNAGAPNN